MLDAKFHSANVLCDDWRIAVVVGQPQMMDFLERVGWFSPDVQFLIIILLGYLIVRNKVLRKKLKRCPHCRELLQCRQCQMPPIIPAP